MLQTGVCGNSSKCLDLTCVGSFHRKAFMAKTNKKKEDKVVDAPGFYKGYDIRWLKTETSHPDHYLVAEYESLEAGKSLEEQPIEEVDEKVEETNGGEK